MQTKCEWKYTYKAVLMLRFKQQHKRAKAKRKSARDLKNLSILPENSAEGLRSRRECCWGYVSIYENAPLKFPHLPPTSCHNFVVQGKAQLEHSSHIVKVDVEATC